MSLDYIRKKEAFVNMTIVQLNSNAKELQFFLSQSGVYETAPKNRTISLRLIGKRSSMIESVNVNNLYIKKKLMLSCDHLVASVNSTLEPFYCDGIDGNRPFVLIWLSSNAVTLNQNVTIKLR